MVADEKIVDKLIDWKAMRSSKQYKKLGEAWLQSLRGKFIQQIRLSRFQTAMKAKRLSTSALRARPQKRGHK